jgi:hypothetical protein
MDGVACEDGNFNPAPDLVSFVIVGMIFREGADLWIGGRQRLV